MECVRVSGKERVWRSFERTNAEALKRVCAHCGARCKGESLSPSQRRAPPAHREPPSLSQPSNSPSPTPSHPRGVSNFDLCWEYFQEKECFYDAPILQSCGACKATWYCGKRRAFPSLLPAQP